MRELKKSFEAQHAGVTLNLVSGVSRDLAGRIVKGETCDVFAPSSPAVIEQDLMGKKVAGSDRDGATWYVVFSANEMVVITAKGNPLGLRQVRRSRSARREIRARHGRQGSRYRPHHRVRQARDGAGRQARARAGDRRSARRPIRRSRPAFPMSSPPCARAAPTRASSTTRRQSPHAPTSTPSDFPQA